MTELTREMEWFLCTLDNGFGVKVQVEDVSVETVELGKEEMDCLFIPVEEMAELHETLLYEMMIVDDEKQDEWLGAVAFYPDSPEWCL